MSKENKTIFKKKTWKVFVFSFFAFFLLGFFSINLVKAAAILTTDIPNTKVSTGNWMDSIANWAKSFTLEKFYNETLKNAVAETFWAASNKALNTIAYDTATWIGSGGKGQKPLFVTEGWGSYLTNIGDNFVGEYITTLSKQWDANLCRPSADIRFKILGGLVQQQRPKRPACTFTEMKQNWTAELTRKDFMSRFQNMFEPYSNDFGIALSLQSNLIDASSRKMDLTTNELVAKKGWLDVTNIAGKMTGIPTQDMVDYQLKRKAFADASVMTKTTATFADAINVFLNQLAATLFDTLLKKLGSNGSASTPYTGDYGLSNYNSSRRSGGIAEVKDQFKKVVEPNFTVRGDYNVLAELTMCPDPTKAGPTNCVITDKFRQAVADRMTVGQAMKAGYLNSEAIFGFISKDHEPKYDEGYPYRSMMILRKFRIIPSNWEVAAQYINDNPGTAGIRNLGDLVSCFSPTDNYTNSANFNESWCVGLIDPSWVLKAPLNYCKKEGYGPEILAQNVVGEGDSSKLIVARNDNYCADEQSCVKEKEDGSCDIYGYCTEERRKWGFGANSCDARYNTCQTYRSREGSSVSYLQNTLGYSCTADTVGCRKYMQASILNNVYDVASSTVSWVSFPGSINLNSKSVDCQAEDESCHQYIRMEYGNGINFLGNFESTPPAGAVVVSNTNPNNVVFGQTSVHLSSNINTTVPIFNGANVDLGDDYYTLSFSAKNCGVDGELRIGSDATHYSSSTLVTTGDWQRFAVSHYFEVGNNNIFIEVAGITPGSAVCDTNDCCLIDGVMVERRNTASVFKEYGQDGYFYEKLLPNYLEYVCYVSPNPSGLLDYTLRDDAPAICNTFAHKCTSDQVGCKLFTDTSNDMDIPAVVKPLDYCDASCDGYDNYIMTKTSFESQRDEILIPSKSKKCNALTVGCDAFTNLDKIGADGQPQGAFGAELIEYYSEFKQCVKNDNATCNEFYTWEGSSETGYQLKMHRLSADVSGSPDVTTVGNYDNKSCTSPLDMTLDNPLCMEFYNKTGQVSYRFLPYTITCSENCHPYRRKAVNSDLTIAATDCTSSNGTWNATENSCIYNAIPGEGKKCAATQDGCREYNGNSGANVQNVLQSDFEGSTSGWTGLTSTITIDSESLKAGEESLRVAGGDGDISIDVRDIARQGKSYHLTFLAKSTTAAITQFDEIYFSSSTVPGLRSSFETAGNLLTGDWKVFEFNLSQLDHEVSNSEKLIIDAGGDFFIDSIILTEITDRYYLITGSSQIPEACETDIFGNWQGPNYNLGCAKYSDVDNQYHYLKSFTRLCSDSASGCEMVIDTHNSDAIDSTTVNGVTTPADNIAYVVYSRDKECVSSAKGCEKLGLVYSYPRGATYENIYTDTFKINDPNLYETSLCTDDEVGCEEWFGDGGIEYFKDPYEAVCEWRQASGTVESYVWYKKKVNRCDMNDDGVVDDTTSICHSTKDCQGHKCMLDKNNYDCPISDMKSVGTGGTDVLQPGIDNAGHGWTGICPASESGCTEYFDPISNISSNIVYNPTLKQDVDANSIPDGFTANRQNVPLERNNIYIFSIDVVGSNSATFSNLPVAGFYELDESNNWTPYTAGSYTLTTTSGMASKMFYYNGNGNISASVIYTSNPVAPNSILISVRKGVASYQIAKDVDKKSCNGALDYSTGCVLFNERKVASSTSGLLFDADRSLVNPISVSPPDETSDSNILLKVSPDRACDKWLACKSYVKDESNNNVCYSVGLCNSFDDNGNCNSFLNPTPTNQAVSQATYDKFKNISGYSEIGFAPNSFNKDMLPLAAMRQTGSMLQVSNGDFEFFNENKYPQGWNSDNGSPWTVNLFSVINNPVASQKEGISYDGRGRAFLKYSPAAGIMESEFIDVEPSGEYFLSLDVNTQNYFAKGAAGYTFYAEIVGYNAVGANTGYYNALVVNPGLNWHQEVKQFTVGAGDFRIKIRFYGVSASGVCSGAGDTCSGSVYVDNVAIKPVLLKRNTFDYITPTCRLYPESDSLSCQYYEDSGIKQKGRFGYCLEYDRYPGNPNACLLWYPVDRVRGDWEENVLSYQGKMPVYYCEEAQFLVPVEYRRIYGHTWDSGCDQNTNYSPGGGYSDVGYETGCTNGPDCDGDDNMTSYRSIPNGACLANSGGGPCSASTGVEGWYAFNGFQTYTSGYCSCGPCDTINEANDGIRFYDPVSRSLYDNTFAYCTRISQTVTNVGNNKYWSGRVYSGSNYRTQNQGYGYNWNSAPFGSMSANMSSGASGWDNDNNGSNGIQPFLISGNSSLSTAGYPYSFVGVPAGFTAGTCQLSGKICLSYPGLTFAQNPAGCGPSEGSCVPLDNSIPAQESIKRIFAQSYGTWGWDGTHYVTTLSNWSVPTNICGGGAPTTVRPAAYPTDFCGIPPRVENLRINGVSNNIILRRSGLVNLTFNSILDSQQLPLVMYNVSWGDNNADIVSGIEMMPRAGADSPNSLYYLYDYWDLKARHAVDKGAANNNVYCGDPNTVATNYNGVSSNYNCINAGPSACCVVKPEVKLKDNWGWCTEGSNFSPCSFTNRCSGNAGIDCTVTGNNGCVGAGYCIDGFYQYPSWIIVTEN